MKLLETTMSEIERLLDSTRMTDTEADFETLGDMRQYLGQFATFIDMIER